MTTIQQVITSNLVIPINNVDSQLLTEIQTDLSKLGYYNLPIDGIYGNETQTAWTNFKEAQHQCNFNLIGAGSLKILQSDVILPTQWEVPKTAIELIKEFEGFFPNAYPDPIWRWNVATIGYGTIKYPNGQSVKRGDSCTLEQAIDWLYWELNQKDTPSLQKIPNWYKMTNNQRSALYSFAYNLGADFYGSDEFNSITSLLNTPSKWIDISIVHHIFDLYDNPNTDATEGLKRRREAEATLFLS